MKEIKNPYTNKLLKNLITVIGLEHINYILVLPFEIEH